MKKFSELKNKLPPEILEKIKEKTENLLQEIDCEQGFCEMCPEDLYDECMKRRINEEVNKNSGKLTE